ncbi:hypothetical protein [Kamptonema formosum]|uniref:hypothetical protein n=1 Tax=Kamptonema formosum TaxID=331992 RepID=UPI0012DE0A2B|nr:hypothetical protein [Oscillatoria sp. PCC 10802]
MNRILSDSHRHILSNFTASVKLTNCRGCQLGMFLEIRQECRWASSSAGTGGCIWHFRESRNGAQGARKVPAAPDKLLRI